MSAALQIIDLQVEDESKRFAPHAKMAASIIEIKQGKGRCTPKDLYSQGYTPDEVVRHWHSAHSIASLAMTSMT